MLFRLRSRLARVTSLAFLLVIGSYAAQAQAPSFPACDAAGTRPQYSICEIVLPQTTYTTEFDAYTKPDVRALFTNNSTGATKTVHGFYDIPAGTSQIVYKIRFNASEQGSWSYSTSCVLQSNPATSCNVPALVTGPKFFTVGSSSERGFLRRDAGSPTRFVYDNGYHPFVWGQTYYQIINNAVSNGLWKTAVDNSKARRLNKIRMLLYPWWDYYAPYGDTQPFAGTKTAPNHDKLNIPHWRKFDEVVNYLYNSIDSAGSRMLAEIILFKDPALGKDANGNNIVLDNNRTFGQNTTQDDRYVKYAVARFGAFPNVMWCLSNEWQFAVNDKTYWNARANTLAGTGPANSYDPWMYSVNGSQRRALSIHPRNEKLFSFADQAWPSHAVLEFSIGHPACTATNPCTNSDEWANFSILNNLSNGRPVFNDEYGYLNSKIGGSCANPTFSRAQQRRAMWAIAVAGGYGTFGDASGQCPDPGSTPPIQRSDWVAQNAYIDVQAMSDFFINNFPNTWWQMAANNARVSPDASNSMRVYALERPGEYVVYAVPTGSAIAGAFKINNLPIGGYTAAFYNPRNGAFEPTTYNFNVSSSFSSIQINLPAVYDDWVVKITGGAGG
jgi:hypothetical protein